MKVKKCKKKRFYDSHLQTTIIILICFFYRFFCLVLEYFYECVHGVCVEFFLAAVKRNLLSNNNIVAQHIIDSSGAKQQKS